MYYHDLKKAGLITTGALLLSCCCCGNSTEPVNQSPSVPNDLFPAEGATDVETSVQLSWSGSDPDGDDLVYDIYLGPNSAPELLVQNIDSNSYTADPLEYNSLYYWRVIADDGSSNPASSPIYTFTTTADNNQAPSQPFDPSPLNGATDVSSSILLVWDCIDADEDALSYDLYLGTDFEPILVESDIQSNSFNAINLKLSSSYYWKIKARDSHGNVSEGPQWSFQTLDHSGNDNEREFELGDSGISISMVWIEPGTFRMGAQSGESGANGDEYPRHLVTIPQGFWIGKYETTQAQWEAVVGSWQFHFDGNPNRPAEMVSWNQIHNNFLSNINNPEIGEPWRLPSEAEWEYACRGGISGTRFWWGNDNDYRLLDNYAWYWDNNDMGNGHETQDVGLKQTNPFGIYDMNGNVWEWCEDYYRFNYNQVPTDGSAANGSGGNGRVARGGGWGSYGAVFCRSAARARNNPQFGYDIFGFRLVRNGD